MQRITRCAFLVALFLVGWGSSYAQKEDYVWFFGDSLLLDFNTEPPTVLPIARAYTVRTCASLCDSTGQLLFYMNHHRIFNADHELVEGGINSDFSWDQSSWILPSSEEQGKYFVLAMGRAGCASPRPCFNSNLMVVSEDSVFFAYKNRIHQNNMCPKVGVTRHANGQDYWIVSHERNSRKFFTFLLTKEGVQGPFEQVIGSVIGEVDDSYIGGFTFSFSGEKLANVGLSGVVELFEFDRCNGILSNYQQIVPGQGSTLERSYGGVEFSPDESKLYIAQSTSASATGFPGLVLQLNLKAMDPWVSRDTVWISTAANDEPIWIMIGPDQKLYLNHYSSIGNQGYDSINQNMSVIHSPDSLGTACNFSPHSLSVAPYKTTLALPNFPNYRLGPITIQPANAGANQKICLGDSIQIGTPDTSSIPLVYSWWPTTGLDNPNSPTPMASPQNPTTYYLTVTDTSKHVSCNFTEDSVSVSIDLCWYEPHPEREVREQLPVITNLITQNGDGEDETFEIRWVPAGTKVRIFDTWGRVLFVSESYQNDWPQRSVGSGVYYYEVVFPGNEEVLVGKILVVGE